MTPEDVWKLEPEYTQRYEKFCEAGAVVAKGTKVAVVSIARNAMPFLENTLQIVDDLASRFRSAVYYVYENDSTDGTAQALDRFAVERPWVTVQHDTLGTPDDRGWQPERTGRLAVCRNRCRDWVEGNANDTDWVIVLDADPHGGFSVPGVMNSIGWLADFLSAAGGRFEAGAMASFSLYVRKEGEGMAAAQYDAYAARMNHWEDRKECPGGTAWFHSWFPPVGSPPVLMNSAFGGLCVYTRRAFLSSRYGGVGVDGKPDCEHVVFHHGMKRAGYQLYLNPGSRYIAVLP